MSAVREKSAAEIALDEIAAACGCPEWDYPGQVVRDVAAVIAERDDLAATLETRTAEHALAMARVAELEAIIAGRDTPPTESDEIAAFRAGLRVIRLGAHWHVYDADGRICAWPTAEVSRG